MKSFIDKEYIKTTLQRLRLAILTLIKWMLCSIASGIVIGLIGAFFHSLLDLAAEIRTMDTVFASNIRYYHSFYIPPFRM